jgi:hypothetical protein
MTNYRLSLHFKLNPNYFGSMDCISNDKYTFIMSFHADKKKSVLKYIDYVKTLIQKMENILEFYSNKEWLYGKKLFEAKISNYGARKQVYLEDCKAIYTPRESMIDYFSINFSTIQKWESIIKLLYKKLFLKKIVLFRYRAI